MKDSTILVVDDEPNNFDVIQALLNEEENYQLHYASGSQQALEFLDLVEPDLILLDIMMPGIDGIETCHNIKTLEKWEAVPIIMVTALTEKRDLALCLSAGASDFISKPINRVELNARVQSMLRIRQQYQQLKIFNTSLEAMVQDRTAQLQKMIFQDELTQLPSRAFLIKELEQRLQSNSHYFAIIILDCDDFKKLIGSFGYEISNQLLVAISERIKSYLQPKDLLIRLVEDAFCILLEDVDNALTLERSLKEIIKYFESPFLIENCDIFMTACLGATLSDGQTTEPEKILQNAYTAMYQAKARGRSHYQIFEPQMHLTLLNRLTLESDLQRALKKNEFIIYYQPIVDLLTGDVISFEALVRWSHRQRGLISPNKFVPYMEATGLIIPLGLLVLEQACQQLSIWHQRGWKNISISVNLSTRQFESPTLINDIDRILQQTFLDPSALKLEITESAVMKSPEAAITVIKQLRDRQIQISIDDFGTGYSSLGYLHQFPVNNLKIDRSFVNQITSDYSKYHVVDTVVFLSKKMGLSVIAEGIETEQQLMLLRSLKCEYGQGYFFAKPSPSDEIEQLYGLSSTSSLHRRSQMVAR